MAENGQKIFTYFEPSFLLGLTATPERMDDKNVLELFENNVPFELRLRDAIINDLVVPFHYYAIRDEYNQRNASKLRMAALFIFLNRTCFNGLYRVNSKNLFNVPFGKYVNPKICDTANLRQVSDVLKKVVMENGDYADLLHYACKGCFIYLDPPYKPISETSTFNSYCAGGFDDNEQIRLRGFCDAINKTGTTFMLSNSDPSSVNPENDFFDRIYSEYKIKRVKAKKEDGQTTIRQDIKIKSLILI